MVVRLITGPPGAGKNTYIEKSKKDGDVVFDFDLLKDMTGSVERAKVMREAFENDVQNYDTDVWVIRCVADAKARTELAERLKAEQVVVLETDADTAKQRVKDRNRNPERNDEVFAAIDDWWSQYGVVESDLIVRPDTGQSLSDRKKQMGDTEVISGPETDKGFPAETKIVDMTPEQQAAYWRFQSRKHEGNAKDLKAQLEGKGETKPETKPEAKPEGLDENELFLKFKKQQAPELVRDHFEAVIPSTVKEEVRDAFLEDLDLFKFVKDDGSIDKERIRKKAALLVPETVTPERRRKVPSHQGNRQTDNTPSVDSGKALFEEFSKKR